MVLYIFMNLSNDIIIADRQNSTPEAMKASIGN